MEEIGRQIQQAAQAGTPQISDMPEIQDFYTTALQNQSLAPLGQAMGTMAGVERRAEEEAAEAARRAAQQKAQDDIARLEKLANPNSYRITERDDGSTRILDFEGNEVSVADYASIAGVSPAHVLRNSSSARERQFATDYQKMQEIADAIVNGDTFTLSQLKLNDPQRFKVVEFAKVGTKNNEELISNMMIALRNYYPEYFGGEGRHPDTAIFPSLGATDQGLSLDDAVGIGAPVQEEGEPSRTRQFLSTAGEVTRQGLGGVQNTARQQVGNLFRNVIGGR